MAYVAWNLIIALMPSRVWSPADALALRCPVESVGYLIPASVPDVVLDRVRPSLPDVGEIQSRTVAALLRIAEHESAHHALRACETLLRMFPVTAPATEGAPDWHGLDRSARYMPAHNAPAYDDHAYDAADDVAHMDTN